MPKIKDTITANGIDIRINITDEADFISLTDIAKYRDADNPRFIIQNWLRNRSTVSFLGLWETINNPNFNRVEFEAVKNESGDNGFVLTPQKWIETTNAIGIVSKAGRYGGTYAHSDIAFEFASWLSPEFKLYIIKDYQRLKTDESRTKALDWNVKRAIAKANYKVHTDAIKENLIPPYITKKQVAITYANEADVINIALFGKTARQWRDENPEAKNTNIRDAATVEQLIVLSSLESFNAYLINNGVAQADRLSQLNTMAIIQLRSLLQESPKSVEQIKKLK